VAGIGINASRNRADELPPTPSSNCVEASSVQEISILESGVRSWMPLSEAAVEMNTPIEPNDEFAPIPASSNHAEGVPAIADLRASASDTTDGQMQCDIRSSRKVSPRISVDVDDLDNDGKCMECPSPTSSKMVSNNALSTADACQKVSPSTSGNLLSVEQLAVQEPHCESDCVMDCAKPLTETVCASSTLLHRPSGTELQETSTESPDAGKTDEQEICAGVAASMDGQTTLQQQKDHVAAAAKDAFKQQFHKDIMVQCDHGLSPTSAAVEALFRCAKTVRCKMPSAEAAQSEQAGADNQDFKVKNVDERLSPKSGAVAVC